MKADKKNALSGQERARARNERNTQYSFFNSIILNFSPNLESFSDCGSVVLGERVTGRAPHPDFTQPPWPGVMRVLYWSYRLDLPSLRAWTLETIKQDALRK